MPGQSRFLFGAAADGTPSVERPALAPLRWLGGHSYELYLFHIVVLGLMRNALGDDPLAYDALLP